MEMMKMTKMQRRFLTQLAIFPAQISSKNLQQDLQQKA